MVTQKDPDKTREKLLQSAYEEIRRYGFQQASLSRIIADTGVTKGALYHHFKSKSALGYAVVDERIRDEIERQWVIPLRSAERPLDALVAAIISAQRCLSAETIHYGCPLNNLAQEMALVDEGFRLRLDRIYTIWRDGIAEALARAKAEGVLRSEVNTLQSATFTVAALEGILGLSKVSQESAVLDDGVQGLIGYLESLRLGSL